MEGLACSRGFELNTTWLSGLFFAVGCVSPGASELSVTFGQAPGVATIEARGVSQGQVGALMFSDDLANWFPVAATTETSLGFSERSAASQRFFQLVETAPPTLSASANWKTTLSLPSDKFLVEFKAADGGAWVPPGTKLPKETQWVKFTVLMDDLATVYFQDGNQLKFHYDFGIAHVPEFDDMTHMAFDGVTLYHAGRRAVMGAVLFSEKNSEYAIQLVGQDMLPAPMVHFIYQLVDGEIDKPGTLRGLYMPTYEQADGSGEVAEYLAQYNVPVVSAQRWETGSDAIYSFGWAMGRLVFVEGDKITAAFRNGDLTSDDILLTDHVPAEIPRVAGIVAMNPSTPNSHVAILAKNFGIPFYYEGTAATREELLSLAGREVMLRTSAGWGINSSASGSATLVALEDDLPESFRQAVADYKAPPELEFEIKNKSDTYTLAMNQIKPSDSEFVGGKAAKFSLLRKLIPKNSPDPAIAITFDLWDEFMEQRLANDKSMRHEIDARLAKAHQSGLQSDLADALKTVRDLIRDGEFVASQRQAIIAALSPFDRSKKIRFRSSTNMEDSRHFTGAGLYDSYSGCLLDDLDDDTDGPCGCDGSKSEERGVFRAIKRVYASFYNDNAYLERRHFGVDEDDVGMAILVHHSFPDEIELANGVAVSDYNSYSAGSFNMWSDLSTQVGATSVANPDSAAVPEEVNISFYKSSSGSTGRTPTFNKRSSLLQVGRDHVMDWKSDYETLHKLLEKIAPGFSRYAIDRKKYTLDFEYKKVDPDWIVVKQVREVPQPKELTDPTPILAGGQATLRLFQGETGGGGVFAYHRLKSIWNIDAASRVLETTGQKSSLINAADWTRVVDGETLVVEDGIAGWPKHRFSTGKRGNETVLVDQWQESRDGEITRYKMSLVIPRWLPDRNSPTVFVGELPVYLEANYSKPLENLSIDWQTGKPTYKAVKTEEIQLSAFDPNETISPDDLPQDRLLEGEDGKKIEIEFFWPPHPTGPTAGYTAPLKAWKQTTITGLLDTPLVLKGWFSQTYAPGHHNFWEEFIFEPSMEEGISEELLAEMEEADVKRIYVFIERWRSANAMIIGFDGEARVF
jgi:hypothetical protein